MRTKSLFVVALLMLLGLLASCGGPLGDATLSGSVVDAVSNAPVQGAEICLVADGAATNLCAFSNELGEFTLSGLPEGRQTIQVSADGYTTLQQDVDLTSGATTSVVFALNPQLSAGEYRIVLSWGSEPADLDAHLWVPVSSDAYYEVYFDDQGSCTAEPWACLDADDTDGYGPETITVAQELSGTYSFAVHWYSGTGSWAGSDAVVKVYDASGLLKTYYAPSDTTFGEDSWWYVFDLDGGVIVTKDSLSDTPPLPSSVSVQQVK